MAVFTCMTRTRSSIEEDEVIGGFGSTSGSVLSAEERLSHFGARKPDREGLTSGADEKRAILGLIGERG